MPGVWGVGFGTFQFFFKLSFFQIEQKSKIDTQREINGIVGVKAKFSSIVKVKIQASNGTIDWSVWIPARVAYVVKFS